MAGRCLTQEHWIQGSHSSDPDPRIDGSALTFSTCSFVRAPSGKQERYCLSLNKGVGASRYCGSLASPRRTVRIVRLPCGSVRLILGSRHLSLFASDLTCRELPSRPHPMQGLKHTTGKQKRSLSSNYADSCPPGISLVSSGSMPIRRFPHPAHAPRWSGLPHVMSLDLINLRSDSRSRTTSVPTGPALRRFRLS